MVSEVHFLAKRKAITDGGQKSAKVLDVSKWKRGYKELGVGNFI
jgi:hypothetical protein